MKLKINYYFDQMIDFVFSFFKSTYQLMLDTFFKVGRFTRLIDEQNQLSITNIAVLVVLFKVGTAQEVDIHDAGLILIALLNYGYKRYMTTKELKEKQAAGTEKSEIMKKFEDEFKGLKDKVSSLQVAVGLTRPSKR